MGAKVQIDYRGYFLAVGKVLKQSFVAVKKTSSVIFGVNLHES